MAETVSSTTAFNLPVDEIIEDALEMVGGEHTSGYEARSARRSLNLLLIDLRTRGVPLYNLEERTLSITSAGGATYNLATDVLGIIDVNVSETDGDTPLAQMSWLDYFSLTDKTGNTGKPSTYVFNRTGTTPTISFYQAPNADYTIKYWCIRKHKDVSQSYQLLDLHTTYLPAIVAGLAYFMSLKRPGTPLDIIKNLEMLYKERVKLAQEEDRDRGDIQIYPELRRS